VTRRETASSAVLSSKEGDGSASSHLAKSAGIIGTATLTSRVLGLIRDQVLAYLFGAGNAMDAFNVATRIPNLMRDLFAEGAMSAAFVPTFTRYLAKNGRSHAWRLGNQLLSALVVATGLIVIAGIIFAEPLTRMLAGSYSAVPGKLELTVLLTRILMPFLTLVAAAAALMGMLNSLNRFFTPALSPAMYNVGIIASGALLVPMMPGLGLDPIVAIAIGALVGGVGQVAIQFPALYREGFRFHFGFTLTDPGLRDVLRLMGPGTLAGAAVQINLLVNMVLATGEGTGAVSWLGYAFRVMYLPIGLFGVSIAAASLPTVSRHAAHEDLKGMRETISRALRLMLMLNVPATIGLIALGHPIVQLIFERGSFSSIDTVSTTAALLFYAPGLVGYSAVRIAVPAFYALGNSLLPAYISMATVVLNIALNLVLVTLIGYQGLALGTSVAALANALVLLIVLNRRLEGLNTKQIVTTGVKITIASLVMGAAATLTHSWLLLSWVSDNVLTRFGSITISIGVGLIVLVLTSRLLRLTELDQAWQQLRSKLG
jgi:putative peptidoglycan lipid II flippase|tara:strand:- start:758 stop:2389 length:1632 start_codon:yes stop_codon:yes gene_type:complete